MGVDYQMHRASVNVAKGLRQFQKAETAYAKEKIDSTVGHIKKGLNYFATAIDHVAQAEDDAYTKAGEKIDKGNKEMKKAADAYDNGHVDTAQNYFMNAMDDYDKALDLIG